MLKSTARPTLGALALAATLAGAPARAAPDAKLLDAATQAQPAAVDLLKSMVAIESGSGDAPGLAKMADLVEARLKALGFRTERRKSGFGARAESVVATLSGSGTRTCG